MGCDIHIEVFVMHKGEPHYVSPPPNWLHDPYPVNDNFWRLDLDYGWPDSRDYDTFGILAGVRGDYGSFYYPRRGFPEWWPENNKSEVGGWNARVIYLDLGDHSHSWLSLGELRRLPWREHGQPDLCQFSNVFIPMLEKIERRGVSQDDIIVCFGFDS